MFDGVFVLEVDLDTLNRRLAGRPEDEWGRKEAERELIARLHQTREDIPKNGTVIDATAPVARVVDEILRQAKQEKHPPSAAARSTSPATPLPTRPEVHVGLQRDLQRGVP